MYTGRAAEALEAFALSKRLDPHYPSIVLHYAAAVLSIPGTGSIAHLAGMEPSRPLMWPIWLYLSDDGKRDRLPAALRPTSAMLAYSAKGAFCRKSTDEGRVYPGMNFDPKSAMKLSLVVFGWSLAMPQRHVVN